MALSLADANRIIGASIAEAERIGVKLSVAVVDGGGQLMAFQRMEGAIAVSATAAPGKAVGSVFFGRDSREINADSPVMQAIIGSQGGRIIPAQGAIPIYQDGDLVGAIGGSGGTAQEDEDCVRKGLEAL
ncbi:MAG: heme-binding protein [Chloroflexi bacterium]|nr:heme-binding protein [Chloroflexota bacterium]MYE40126.1 heme-binding protein [Chloroflexota bacterium]